ncbi:MAG: PTS fructose transporter subunit IIA [Proteobacteria bacterium]|jgi:PTS system ascorbate-specific IIA component|nr:PTS fructose transporter subunit IIA [Pseudomonadota bacterium]
MVNIIIMAHSEIANSFAYCVEHILSKRISKLHILVVKKTESSESVLARANEFIYKIGSDQEILILTDLYGATPSNIAQKLLKPGSVELITGLNLPMLIRAISYANSGLRICVDKAISGAMSGIIHLGGIEDVK